MKLGVRVINKNSKNHLGSTWLCTLGVGMHFYRAAVAQWSSHPTYDQNSPGLNPIMVMVVFGCVDI